MIITLILGLLSPILTTLISLLPNPDVTVLAGINSVIDTYIVPMFSIMKVYLPMDVIYNWSAIYLGVHVSIIVAKQVGKMIYALSGGLIRSEDL